MIASRQARLLLPPPSSGWIETYGPLCKQYGALTHSQLLRKASASVRYLVSDLILSGSLGILIGQWGLGKTPFAVQLGLTLAAGCPTFLGRYSTVAEPVPTLYFDFENGAAKMAELAKTISSFMKLDKVPDEFRVFNPGISTKLPPRDMFGYLSEMITNCRFRFVIIDPLRMLDPTAEDKNALAAQFIQRLRALIAATGATVLLIHHPRKRDSDDSSSLDRDPTRWMEGASGASALVQNVDFRIGFDKDGKGNPLIRSFIRVKGWGPVLDLKREFDPAMGAPVGYRLQNAIDTMFPNDRKVFDQLGASFTTGELKKILGLGPSSTDAKLKEWEEDLAIIKKLSHGKWEKVSQEDELSGLSL